MKGGKTSIYTPARPVALAAGVLVCLFLASCSSLRHTGARANHENRAEKEKNEALMHKYSEIIGEPINSSSLPLYKAIDGWMGVPYCYGACTKAGTDCSGFTASIYQQVYHIKLDHSSLGQLENDVRVISKASLSEGDLVFFTIEEGKKVSHVGIYLGNNKFVHASAKKGVCINDLTEKYYEQHFRKAGRVTVKPTQEGNDS